MKKNIITVFISLMAGVALAAPKLAQSQPDEHEVGQLCGPTLYWQYDSVTTTLRIYGQGDMNDFSVGTNPWYQYREQIRYVQLEEGLTSMGSRALDGLGQIDSIYIPASLTKIADNALCGPQYKRIVVDSANTVFDSRDDCNAIIETATNRLRLGSLTTVIPSDVHRIGPHAYCRQYGIQQMPDLTHITWVESDAFYGFRNIRQIDIPAGLTKLGPWAFGYLSKVETIVVDSLNPTYDSRDSCNAIIETATNTLLTGCKNTIIPASVEHISSYAFCDCNTLSLLECYLDKPLPASTYTFGGVHSTCVLRVNPGTKALYEAAPYWNKFVIEERTTQPDVPTENSAIVVPSVQTEKLFHNGQIMIRKGHNVYTLMGTICVTKK